MSSFVGGETCAMIETSSGPVLLSMSGGSVDMMERWVARVRAPTAAELQRVRSPRIMLVRAPRTAKVRELVAACANPARALELDDPNRTLRAGEAIKCTDR
jgi:hypothetical protein